MLPVMLSIPVLRFLPRTDRPERAQIDELSDEELDAMGEVHLRKFTASGSGGS